MGPERGVEAVRDGDEGEDGGVGGDVEDEAEAVGGRGEELAREQHGEVRGEQRGVGKLCERESREGRKEYWRGGDRRGGRTGWARRDRWGSTPR